MSRLSIYANSWINLVFEGKNQEYGAFQLRQKSDETTLLAFCLGVSFVAMIATIPMLITSFTPQQADLLDPTFDPIIHLSNYKPNQPKGLEKMMIPATKKKKDDVKKEELINPEIVKPEDANQDIAKANEHPTKEPHDMGDDKNKGDNQSTGSVPSTAPALSITVPEDAGEILNTTETVDKVPEFPGGISAFYGYIGDNFRKLDVEETVSVIVAFVVEKDGNMSDIRVLRSAAPSIDREAIRVLQSMRTQWKPGIKNGKPVRTAYKLPIKVKKQITE